MKTLIQDVIQQLGVIVRDGEKVMEIKPGLPVVVKTTSRSYQAKSLIITAGPWTNQLLRPLGVELPLQTLRINVCYWREKVPGSYGVSQAFPCFLGLDFSLAPHHIYGLPSGEYPGLMKVCYHHGNNADPEERDCPTAFSDIKDVHILSRFVRDRLPDLEPEPAVMEHCMYTNTPDKHFILDRHPKYDNIVIGAGFSGHGFKLSPVVGKILYELSMKLTPSYDLTPFRISRFLGLGKAHL